MKHNTDLKVKRSLPTKGQFVAMWEYNGIIWSTTYVWDDGDLFEWRWDAEEDDLVLVPCSIPEDSGICGNPTISYVVAK